MSPAAQNDEYARRLQHAGLTDLIDLDVLQRLQERFTALGQMTVCICHTDGSPLTRPTWGSRYSELIGTTPRGRAAFAQAVRASALDLEPEEPFTCHEGMTLYAVPIVDGSVRLAVIVVGTRYPIPPPPPRVREIARMYGVDAETLLATVDKIDPYRGGSPEAIREFADILADTIATLYAQRAHIERQFADLQVVHELADMLASSRNLQEILDTTVQRVVATMPVKACGIRLLDEETGELVIKAVCNLSDEYLRKGPVTLKDNAIDGEAFRGRSVYIEDAPNDPRIRYPDNARREGIASGLCVPMIYRGRTIGVIRVYTSTRYVFSESEQALLRSIGSQAASAIVNSRLRQQQAATEQVRRQVVAAAEIQRRMLPSSPPSYTNLEFGCVYVPTLQVGGDFYDFIELADGRWGLCIADVVGKGVPAALMMSSIRAALRAYADCSRDLAETLADVNRHMVRDTLIGEFASMVYGVFSADGRSLTYASAGHLPPLLLRGDIFVELKAGGGVLGVMPEEVFETETVALEPGDVIVMTTDGVTEAMDFDGRMYGHERLLASIRRHCEAGARQLAKQILWDVRRFAGLADQSDDITVVAVVVG